MGAYPAQAIISIQVYQSYLFREPPLRPSHRLYQLSFPCVLIITQLRWFVKTLFEFFPKRFFQPLLHLDFLTHSAGFCCEFYQPSRLCCPYYITTLAICQAFFSGAVVGVEPTFSKRRTFPKLQPCCISTFL